MQDKKKADLEKIAGKILVGKGGNPDAIIKSLEELKKLTSDESILLLNHFACIEKEPKVLLHIVKEIGKYRDKSSIQVLIDLLTGFRKEKKQYLNVRCMAATILGNLTDESTVISLMYVMNDKEENYRLRLGAADALGRIGNSQAVIPLIKIVSDENEKSVYLRESAAKALGMIDDERAVDYLINILETPKYILDKFIYLKEKVIEALGKLNYKKASRINVLKKVLQDESPYLRTSAIEALCETGEESIIHLIEPMIYDSSEKVAKTAIYALYNIEGKNYYFESLQYVSIIIPAAIIQ